MHQGTFLKFGRLVADNAVINHLDTDLCPLIEVWALAGGEGPEAEEIAATVGARGFALTLRDDGKAEIAFAPDRPAYKTPRPATGPTQRIGA